VCLKRYGKDLDVNYMEILNKGSRQDSCLARHVVSYPSKENFESIWSGGRLLSEKERIIAGKGRGRQIFDLDRFTGDDRYMFLSLRSPVSFMSRKGYEFVFDIHKLMKRYNVKIGITDLLFYRSCIVKMVIEREGDDTITFDNWMKSYISDEVMYWFSDLDKYFRLIGKDAERYVFDVCYGDNVPLSLKRALSWVEKQGIRDDYGLVQLPKTQEEAINKVEVLVPDYVVVSDAVRVCYAYVWFEIADFLSLTDGKKRLPESDAGFHDEFPYRCPFCFNPLVPGDTLDSIVDGNPWFHAIGRDRRLYTVGGCFSCGAWFIDDVSSGELTLVDENDFMRLPTSK